MQHGDKHGIMLRIIAAIEKPYDSSVIIFRKPISTTIDIIKPTTKEMIPNVPLRTI